MLWFFIAGKKKFAFIYGAAASLLCTIMLLAFSLPMVINSFKEPIYLNDPSVDYRMIHKNDHVVAEVNTIAGCAVTKTTDSGTQNYYAVVSLDWDADYSVVDQVILVGVNSNDDKALCDDIAKKTIDYVHYKGDLSEETYHLDGFASNMSPEMEKYARDWLEKSGIPSSRLVPIYVNNNYSSIFVLPVFAGITLIMTVVFGLLAIKYIKRDKLEKEQAEEDSKENGFYGIIK